MTRRRRWSFWMPPLEHPPILALDDLYRGRLTAGGRVLLWGTLATGLALLAARSTPMVLGFGFCASALLLAAIIGSFYRPRLRMTRRITAYPTAGAEFNYRVDVENVGKRTARHVIVEERGLPPELRPVGSPPVIAELAPGERVAVTLRLSCLRRGSLRFGTIAGRLNASHGTVQVRQKVTPIRSIDCASTCHLHREL